MIDNNLEFHNQANEELHQQWEEMLKADPEYTKWLDMMNGLKSTNDSVTQERKET